MIVSFEGYSKFQWEFQEFPSIFGIFFLYRVKTSIDLPDYFLKIICRYMFLVLSKCVGTVNVFWLHVIWLFAEKRRHPTVNNHMKFRYLLNFEELWSYCFLAVRLNEKFYSIFINIVEAHDMYEKNHHLWLEAWSTLAIHFSQVRVAGPVLLKLFHATSCSFIKFHGKFHDFFIKNRHTGVNRNSEQNIDC